MIEKKQDKAALERIEREKEEREKKRQELLGQMKRDEEEREKRKKEDGDLVLWETLQRYKRDKFNKDWNKQKLEEERNNKINYAKVLKKQIVIIIAILKNV